MTSRWTDGLEGKAKLPPNWVRENGQHPRTLDEVGRTFNVTRERVRQIENQSLKKLQALAESQKLRDVAA